MRESEPPNSVEAEKILLSCCIRETEKFEESMSILDVDDFYYENHKVIYSALKKIFNDNKPIDELSLVEELKSRNALDDVGGVTYIYDVKSKLFIPRNGLLYIYGHNFL